MNIGKNKFFQKIDEISAIIDFLLTEYKNIYEILGQNIVYAEKTNDTSLIDSVIRMQVRSTASILESICFSIRSISRDICIIKTKTIPSKYSKLFSSQKRIDLNDKIKLSIQFVGFATSGIEVIDVYFKEWQSVCDLIDKRHKLTHPRNIDDMNVTSRDLDNANTAIIWFTKQMYRIFGEDISHITFKLSEEDIIKVKKQFEEKYK